MEPDQWIHVAEIFAGSRVLSEGCKMFNLRTRAVDAAQMHTGWNFDPDQVHAVVFIKRCDEVQYSRKLDILNIGGFLATLEVVLCMQTRKQNTDNIESGCNTAFKAAQLRHVVTNGVAWFAIPCSSWVFMHLGMTSVYIPRGS